jgi:hypothetical protein
LPEISPPSSTIAITAKSLDSDEVVETIRKVEPASSDLAVRRQLSDLVRSLDPEAELRSFADGAASYLAPKLLIVAIYRLVDGRDDKEGDEDDGQQQQLFAA